MALRAVVRDGHLVVNEATTLPEGTVVNLVVDDEGDDLDEVERAALHAHLESSWTASETARLSECALATDWDRAEEDAAWAHLQQGQ